MMCQPAARTKTAPTSVWTIDQPRRWSETWTASPVTGNAKPDTAAARTATRLSSLSRRGLRVIGTSRVSTLLGSEGNAVHTSAHGVQDTDSGLDRGYVEFPFREGRLALVQQRMQVAHLAAAFIGQDDGLASAVGSMARSRARAETARA